MSINVGYIAQKIEHTVTSTSLVVENDSFYALYVVLNVNGIQIFI